MPVVFVHGVNTRKSSPSYEAGRLTIERFLQHSLAGVTLDGKTLPAGFTVHFPYWGDLATSFAWNMQALPGPDVDALGTGGVDGDTRELVALIRDALGPGARVDEPLVGLARYQFATAVDVLCDTVLQHPQGLPPAEVAEFVVAAQLYALQFAAQAGPPWMTTVQTDAQFIGQLTAAVTTATPGLNALGLLGSIGSALQAGVQRIKQAVGGAKTKLIDRAGDFASTRALAWGREPLNGVLGRFFGDVFIYLNSRGTAQAPGPIPRLILDEWDAARADAPHEPFIVVAHSLGGVISWDLMTHDRPGVDVDLFVSIGSQVSHFEEMKLFRNSDPAVPGNDLSRRAVKPAHIRRWINVFDEVDIFSYACARVFADVSDFRYDTHTYVIKAHGAYFTQARFYERLRARIDQL